MKGILFVVSGPSGVGKGTVLEEVFRQDKKLKFSVSATTREPRPGEVDGVNYFFVSPEKFDSMIDNGEFLEWAHVHDSRYGTPRGFVEKTLNEGFDCVLDIDVQGALNVMKNWEGGVYIFMAPPAFEDLEKRLRNRHTEDEGRIKERIETARWELTKVKEYDYTVVNDVVEKAAEKVRAIIEAERSRTGRVDLRFD
ncbi:MAG: guanylate kinase [Firmicutes bacterium]|nr:guanylate kinase [Bacillota bacterium]